ncbi:short-chain dehydrogenase [Penicillium manginii]|uniref:short-chain dehydrogenase n=1 Tax=Penicillium manginii TaxID=203109 RepID=UPI002548F72D|nr:short-chain dehydrogenase [Penicillium manginii]KAJ5741467.1 short-chain dehydrogenase [Penicillium manginii]
MPQTSEGNVHGLQYREAKPSQGNPSQPVSELFRLDNRTIITDVEDAAKKHHCQLTYFQLDVTDENAVSKTFAGFIHALRYPVKGLVACAGLSLNGPATEFPASSFRRVLDTNVTGTFLIAQATAREMIRTNTTGSMVLVASMSAGYNASKAAVHQLTRSLAAEWGSRVEVPLIRVNSLSPGYIRTAATAESLQKPGMEAQWTGDNMLYRLSTADEFRAPVLFMLGDGSSFMTGADLRVDGGHCSW